MNARRVQEAGDGANTVPNVEAIVQDFQIIGEGLVNKVELRTEKWVVWEQPREQFCTKDYLVFVFKGLVH